VKGVGTDPLLVHTLRPATQQLCMAASNLQQSHMQPRLGPLRAGLARRWAIDVSQPGRELEYDRADVKPGLGSTGHHPLAPHPTLAPFVRVRWNTWRRHHQLGLPWLGSRLW